jgi:methylated-DNA-protein-cysteine methyltransferase-like protein
MTTRRAFFDEQVYRLCRQIPSGCVTTYGRIASLIPPPPGMDAFAYNRVKARWVGYALARCPDSVPWQRVLNARGESSLGERRKLQQALLEQEGVEFDARGRVNLTLYLWHSKGEEK